MGKPEDGKNRRKFIQEAASSAAGLAAYRNTAENAALAGPAHGSENLMDEVRKYRKIDAHEHVGLGGTLEDQLKMADKLGIETLVISRPIVVQTEAETTPEKFRQVNDLVGKSIRQYPNRYLGLFYVNPIYGKESLQEIRRCVDLGMVGLKVYNQVKINNPLFYPIIERLIDLRMVILVHSHCGIGVGGKRTKYGNIQPNVSVPEDLVEIAIRYPQAMFLYAHLGGGGDWEYACKAMADYPNIYADTSGSNNEAGLVDYAVRYLGADRLVFGTDGSYYQGVGTMLASRLNEAERKKVFFENFNRILRKSGNHVH